MKSIVLLCVILVNLHGINAGDYSNCEIEGASSWDWYTDWDTYITIDDDNEGTFHTFETNNIVELLEANSDYLDASYKDGILTLSTNEKFKDFEKEYRTSTISIETNFTCQDGKSEAIIINIEVNDINNHDPVLDKEVYEYSFGTTLPENFDLTKFLTISATDDDFSNKNIYFAIDINEYFKVDYNPRKDSKLYYTALKSLKEIKAPFRKEFTLVATDTGKPTTRFTTSQLIIEVLENGKVTEDLVHPPVFSKHLYFANYTSSNELEMKEAITIKYGAEVDTIIKQSGYEEYFKIAQDPASIDLLKVTKVKPIPKNIIETVNPMVIEIEAENVGLQHMPGRTALIIRLSSPKNNTDGNPDQNSTNCDPSHVTNVYHDQSVVSLIVYLCIILVIVVINVAVLVWYFQKRSQVEHIVRVPMPYAVNEVFNQEKIKV